jgi:hypothetical protein
VLGAVLSLFCSGQILAEESQWSWWPFGDRDTAAQPPVATAPPIQTQPNAAATSESWLARPSLPKMSLPDLPFGDDADSANPGQRRQRARLGKAPQSRRNTWAQPEAAPSDTSPWEAMSNGAHRVGESTRSAWHKTVDIFTPGDSSQPPVIGQAPRQSWWSRMRGSAEPPQDGPRTVTEWMAQERLDP